MKIVQRSAYQKIDLSLGAARYKMWRGDIGSDDMRMWVMLRVIHKRRRRNRRKARKSSAHTNKKILGNISATFSWSSFQACGTQGGCMYIECGCKRSSRALVYYLQPVGHALRRHSGASSIDSLAPLCQRPGGLSTTTLSTTPSCRLSHTQPLTVDIRRACAGNPAESKRNATHNYSDTTLRHLFALIHTVVILAAILSTKTKPLGWLWRQRRKGETTRHNGQSALVE